MSQIHCVYDIFQKKDIFISHGEIGKISKKENIKGLWNLITERAISCCGRYILPKNKNKIFTIVDFVTKKEYDCINIKSLLLYPELKLPLKIPRTIYNKMVWLKRKMCNYASINDKLFYLKGTTILPKTKTNVEEIPELQKIREIRKLNKRIRKSLAERLRKCIKKQKTSKIDSTINLVGCSTQFLIEYLQSKFVDGMSWNNYGKGIGKWAIDHIIPCNSFNMLNPDDQKKCFHYSNLQPLWEKDNRNKGTKEFFLNNHKNGDNIKD